MKVGLFLPLEPELRSPPQQFAAVVEIAMAAETLGYHSVWIASRHFSPAYASVGSPLVLLASVARDTSRIVLGTSVVSLPLEDPLRLAEDFATADCLSSGRIRLGVGTGDDPPAFARLGVDYERRRETMSERLPILIETLEGSDLHPAVTNPRGKVAMAAQTKGGAAWAGSLGIGLLQGRSEPAVLDVDTSQRDAAVAYRAVHPKGPVVTARNVWTGSPDDQLLAAAFARHDKYLRSRGRPGLPDDLTEAGTKLNIVFGTPTEIAERLIESMMQIGTDELLLTVDPGGLALDKIISRIENMAEAFGLTVYNYPSH
ncbi:MAG: LLM class flavin-dependent oxidoreductase [Actinomycetota bacterium]